MLWLDVVVLGRRQTHSPSAKPPEPTWNLSAGPGFGELPVGRVALEKWYKSRCKCQGSQKRTKEASSQLANELGQALSALCCLLMFQLQVLFLGPLGPLSSTGAGVGGRWGGSAG
jgi:hypothetical protein